jgi:N-sulfoglucosamine sulfohydrolase
VDPAHFISGIDFMPTVLDAAGLKQVEGMDGKSFLPLLQGKPQPFRDHVITVFHETSGKQRFEMRAIQNGRFGYIFNAWADGKRIFRNESQSGLTFNAMREAAENDPAVAARVRHFLYRVPEELYDYAADPDAKRNLIEDARFKKEIADLKARLRAHLERTADPVRAQFPA